MSIKTQGIITTLCGTVKVVCTLSIKKRHAKNTYGCLFSLGTTNS